MDNKGNDKPRIPETEDIQEESDVEIYDQMMSGLRDKGLMVTDEIIKAGINKGLALEIGPGPGYLGLEWLKKTSETRLIGIEISTDMIKIATRNSKQYHLEDRVEYVNGNAMKIPFEDNKFDAVFTNMSLHEWTQPIDVFNEIYRVLKPNGKYYISDMRRDISKEAKNTLENNIKPKTKIPGLTKAINASYKVNEVQSILIKSKLQEYTINNAYFTLEIIGTKK